MSLFSDPRWGEALAHLPDYLGNHVRVSVAALTLGLAVSLPLAIAARNRRVMRGVLLGLASIVQTVPGLALLALFYPLLLALAALTLSWFGFGFPAFGFLPAVLALALYSMLPVLRNTITGLNGVEPAILEAAQGVGMTPRQSLFTVELPLALPVMMAGIRTAAGWVIGTATLSTPIGQTSLGNYIFAGLQTQNWVFAALASNDNDAYVDYSGTLCANQFHRSDIRPREELLGELKTMLAKQSITLLGELGFENAYALVMPKKRADALGIHSITDLASHAPTMSLAADYEFFSRPEWAALQKSYGLTFRAQRQMQPDFMYAAIASGEVDVIAGYTSDGLIAKYDLVVLDDPRHAIPPYDAIVLLSPKRANDSALQAATQPLLGKIEIAASREANLRAAGNDATSSPDAVAQWLWDKVGKK